ncbi:hypothetical protein ACFVXC_22855 [Streptomyces sp. NPDC058257]
MFALYADRLDDRGRELRDQLPGARPEMITLADQIHSFAALLVPYAGNDE